MILFLNLKLMWRACIPMMPRQAINYNNQVFQIIFPK